MPAKYKRSTFTKTNIEQAMRFAGYGVKFEKGKDEIEIIGEDGVIECEIDRRKDIMKIKLLVHKNGIYGSDEVLKTIPEFLKFVVESIEDKYVYEKN